MSEQNDKYEHERELAGAMAKLAWAVLDKYHINESGRRTLEDPNWPPNYGRIKSVFNKYQVDDADRKLFLERSAPVKAIVRSWVRHIFSR